MARTSKVQSAATAAQVVLTARGLFTERGYAGVGLEEVAARAGVTRGAVYHHFTSKAGLFEAVLAAVQREVAEAIEREAGRVADPWQRLETGCRVFLAASLGDGVRRVMLVDAPAVLGWDVWRAQDAASSGRLLGGALHELAEAGELDPRTVEATTALLSGAMNEAALWIAGSSDSAAAGDLAWRAFAPMLRALRA